MTRCVEDEPIHPAPVEEWRRTLAHELDLLLVMQRVVQHGVGFCTRQRGETTPTDAALVDQPSRSHPVPTAPDQSFRPEQVIHLLGKHRILSRAVVTGQIFTPARECVIANVLHVALVILAAGRRENRDRGARIVCTRVGRCGPRRVSVEVVLGSVAAVAHALVGRSKRARIAVAPVVAVNDFRNRRTRRVILLEERRERRRRYRSHSDVFGAIDHQIRPGVDTRHDCWRRRDRDGIGHDRCVERRWGRVILRHDRGEGGRCHRRHRDMLPVLTRQDVRTTNLDRSAYDDPVH